MRSTNSTSAGLTLVGVGPGDPSLLTLAAVKAIESATVIAYPISAKDADSMAAEIVSTWINHKKRRLPLVFPMVHEVNIRKKAWRTASNQIANEVINGQRVVFLCEGDVSLFATGSYLLIDLKKHFPSCPIRLIPGVTAMSAAAAIGSWPLAIHQDQLLILPTPNNEEKLEVLIDTAAISNQVLVLLKLGHRWVWVKSLLERKKLIKDALFAERVGWPDQQVLPAIEVPNDKNNYFSMLLLRQSWPDSIS